MNIRKLKRKKELTRKAFKRSKWSNDSFITNEAEKTVKYATEGKYHLTAKGNFIFMATSSGEAWMLDHRDNLALRLADRYEPMTYTIVETKDTFSVEWKEQFMIQDNTFIAIRDGKQSVFFDYPIDTLMRLIKTLKNNDS